MTGEAIRADRVYRHYKGGLYRVVEYGDAYLEKTGEDLVGYRKVGDKTKTWYRPASEWFDPVDVELSPVQQTKRYVLMPQ